MMKLIVCFLAAWTFDAGSTARAGQFVPSEIVAGFDELEIESIDLNIAIALDTVPDRGTFDWFSSSNNATGTVEVLRTYEIGYTMCREISIVSKRRGSTDQRTISFCRGDDYQWHPLTYEIGASQ